jgi:PIN like domain
MARTRSTSRKRSAASSSPRKRPEPLVFFIDRSLGRKKVPEALRAAGVEIRVHDELFPQGTEDVVWLREAGTNGWIVITRDDRIRYNQLRETSRHRCEGSVFSITSSSLTGEEAASLILSALDKMSRLCRQHSKRGFIAKISRGPDVKIIETGRK